MGENAPHPSSRISCGVKFFEACFSKFFIFSKKDLPWGECFHIVFRLCRNR